jgi:hypothetical protein
MRQPVVLWVALAPLGLLEQEILSCLRICLIVVSFNKNASDDLSHVFFSILDLNVTQVYTSQMGTTGPKKFTPGDDDLQLLLQSTAVHVAFLCAKQSPPVL